MYGTVATVPYKYVDEADDAANKVSQRKRIGMASMLTDIVKHKY